MSAIPPQASGGDDQPTTALAKDLSAGIEQNRFLKDGKLWPERRLAEALGVSRARLRRALDVLEHNGTIFRRQGQGTFAAPPPVVEANPLRNVALKVTPRQVMEVRLEVEPALAALAAERASRDEIAMLEQRMHATTKAKDTAAYGVADDIFHYKIAEMAHNPLFQSVYDSIRAVRRQAAWQDRRENTYSAEMLTTLGAQHEDLFRAIAAGDNRVAAAVMETHLLTVSNAMLRERRYDQTLILGDPN